MKTDVKARHRGLLIFMLMMVMISPFPAWADQRDKRLEGLFDRLLATVDERDAAAIQNRIWEIWIEFDETSINALMRDGMSAMSQGDHERALKIFDDLVDEAPDFAEAWNKRATVLYLLGRFDQSVLDIQQTLRLEPRHFGALSGLALIYEALHEPEAALRSLEAALAINPHLNISSERLEQLRQKMQGIRT